MGWLADVRPLRESPAYRRLWIGSTLSGVGGQMTGVAIPVQVYGLTHSSFAVGATGLTVALPLIVTGLFGSAIVDAVDRRKLVLVTGTLMALVSFAFAAQAVLVLRQLWILYALSALQSAALALDQPARRAIVARLLAADRITAATALMQLNFHLNLIAGPLLAGVVIAAAGLQAAYLIDALSFSFALYAVFRLPRMVVPDTSRPGLGAVLDGLRFVRSRPVLAMLLLADLDATVFGMPQALFPALAATRFGGGTFTVGLLYAAPAIGGLLCATFSGRVAGIRRQGSAVLLAIGVWGGAIAGFGLTRILWLAVFLLAVAGAADVVNGLFRGTILQVETPDELRGRVNSLGFVVGLGGPRLGDLEAGTIASLTSPAISAVSGGLAAVFGVILIAWAASPLRCYQARADRELPVSAE